MISKSQIAVGIVVLAGALAGSAQAQDTSHDIKIVLPSAVDVVEPCHMNSTGYIGQVVKQNIVETLTSQDPETSEVKPNLATAWTQVDPLTWHITLREDVNFQDGTPFNADAVVTALDRQFVPELACRDNIRLFGTTTLINKALDDKTVEIVTSDPMPLMPITLSQVGMTAPSTTTTEASRNPVGTGPYKLTEWDPASTLVLTRWDGYWGEQPQVRQATYVWRSEPALRASMVEVGEADIALAIAPQDAVTDGDLGYLNAETNRIRFFMDKPPLDDVRVRRAMNLAIDRDAFIGTILNEGVMKASQFMMPSVNGYDPTLEPWPYDPAAAKELIAEAEADGVPVSNEITLVASDFYFANLVEMMETLIQYWQEVGLNVNLRMVDKVQHSAMRRKPYPTDRGATMVHELHDNTAGDAVFTMMVYYTSAGALSTLDYPELDEVLEEAAVSSGEKRRDLFRQANRMIQQEIVPDVMLYHLVSFIRVGERVAYQPDFTTAGKLELSQITFR